MVSLQSLPMSFPCNSLFCSYKKTLQRLKIREGHVAKVVPDRIFSIAFHPARRKTLVFAGDKWGKIGIWDVVRKKSSFDLHFWSY